MRKPSAALVVATAALVMSTLGTSLAATHYVITSPKQVKPGTITLSALSKQARKALRGERGPRGQAGASGPQGPVGAAGIPGLSATKLWAQIGSDASVNVSTPGVTARLGVSPGTYAVNFGVDITRCAADRDAGVDSAVCHAGLGDDGPPGRRARVPARRRRRACAGLSDREHRARRDDERRRIRGGRALGVHDRGALRIAHVRSTEAAP